ncbi:hypothetical protein VTK26DRAFT_5570 [Humicola hyalothermophila]
MDMDYMDPYHRHYSGLAQHPFGHQQHAHPQGPQYPYWNHLMAYYQHQQRVAAALMGQGNVQLSKPTEPKPRLAKDEVELLEREFAKNPKPSSSTKRELAEQMGVEVPRINNWFQNRRAKEKQMRKTAEAEAQQARERAASESKSSDGQGQGVVSELYGMSNHQQPLGLPTPSSGDGGDNDATKSDNNPAERELGEQPGPASTPGDSSPTGSDSDGFVHSEYDPSRSSVPQTQGMAELAAPTTAIQDSFIENTSSQAATHRQQQTVFTFGPESSVPADGVSGAEFDIPGGVAVADLGAFDFFSGQDFFTTPSVSQFPSEMVMSSAPLDADDRLPKHRVSAENLVKSEAVSPMSMPDSPSTISGLRFKSPPPPTDIAGRRKLRRPAPLGLSALRGGPGPKTGVDVAGRPGPASPIRRISSATGSLHGRVQKTLMGPGGPRSPFAMDRNKEALLQSLQGAQAPMMASLNSAFSPVSPGEMPSRGLGENVMGSMASDEEQSYGFGSLGAVSGLSMYAGEPAAKTPPGTPGLRTGFHEPYFPGSVDQTWNFVPQDEPLPTPSLCSHGGSELEFSMGPQLPGYVASQPATPSFPPVGPTYTGYFGASLGQNTEYHIPESYPTELSARSSPVAPPRSKQFQFAQNITPQDFTTVKGI